MFARAKKRFKDGKEHRCRSVVENVRNPNGRAVQRQVLYLGEINDSQRAAWCRSIEVLQGDSGQNVATRRSMTSGGSGTAGTSTRTACRWWSRWW